MKKKQEIQYNKTRAIFNFIALKVLEILLVYLVIKGISLFGLWVDSHIGTPACREGVPIFICGFGFGAIALIMISIAVLLLSMILFIIFYPIIKKNWEWAKKLA